MADHEDEDVGDVERQLDEDEQGEQNPNPRVTFNVAESISTARRRPAGTTTSSSAEPPTQIDLLAESITAAISRMPGKSAGSKLRNPDTFDGSSPEKLRLFFFQVELWFAANMKDFPSDQTKVIYAMSYLRGSPLDWFESRFTSVGDDDEIDWFVDWNLFRRELSDHFGRADDISHYERLLHHLRMEPNGKVVDYIMAFDGHSARLRWDDSALRSRFYEGLNDRLKDRLAELPAGKPKTLISMKKMVREIDQRYWDRREERKLREGSTPAAKSSSSSAPSASTSAATPTARTQSASTHKQKHTTTSTTSSSGNTNTNSGSSANKSTTSSFQSKLGKDGRLTPEERKRRFDNNLCLICGKGGHRAADCNKSKASQAKAAKVSTPAAEATEPKKA